MLNSQTFVTYDHIPRTSLIGIPLTHTWTLYEITYISHCAVLLDFLVAEVRVLTANLFKWLMC